MQERFSGDYHPGRSGLKKVLGSLESEIMEVVWRKGEEVCVRDVLDEIATRREIAYTTVMTIMGRLAEKKLLDKRKQGQAFYFRPAMTREEFTGRVVGGVLDDLLADFGETAVAHFIDRVRHRDRDTIEKLEQILSELKEQDSDGKSK